MANDCKYQRKQYQISYDSGSTWHNAVPARYEKGELTEYSSPDCSGIEVQYRWRELEGQYICIDNNKYTKEVREESYDNGATWYVSYPTVYKEGYFVEYNEEYCSFKFKGHYKATDAPETHRRCNFDEVWNGYRCIKNPDPLKIVKCNNSDILTKDETMYYIPYYEILKAEIGTCVKNIGNGNTAVFYRHYYLTEIVISEGPEIIAAKAFSGCTSLPNITLPNTLKTIGNNAFERCWSLTSIVIPSSVTSIGSNAFSGCTSLSSVALNNGLKTIGGGAFIRCPFASITIPSTVTSIGNLAFSGCTSLTSVTIGSGVTSIGSKAFSGCTSLSNITVKASTPPSLGSGAFDGSSCSIFVPCGSKALYQSASGWSSYSNRIKVTTPCQDPIKLQFTYAGGNSYVDYCGINEPISSADTHPSGYEYTTMTDAVIGDCVTSIGNNAFYNCNSLTSCTIGSGVTSIGKNAFFSAASLTNIVIPDSVTSIGDYAFRKCTSLTGCTIGSGITSIGEWAFLSCNISNDIVLSSGITSIGYGAFSANSHITSITVEATTPPSLGTYAFRYSYCPIYVPCDYVDVYKSANGWSTYADRIQPISGSCRSKFTATYLDSSTYDISCNRNITLSSGETKPNGYQYTAMTDAVIGDCVTNIGDNSFSGCTSLTTIGPVGSNSSLEIPSGVTNIGSYVFKGCTGLINAVIPNSVTSIGNWGVFSGCSSLTSCTIGSGITSIGYGAFFDCSGLTSIDIPSGVTSIGDYTFYNCTSLTSCTIGSGVTSIGQSAFYSCSGLTSIDIPSGVTSIGDYTFYSCSGLTSIDIPSGVTSIGNEVFKGCRGLTSCTIGSGVTSIGNQSFSDCTSLSSVDIPNSVTSIDGDAFSYCTSLTSCTIGSGVTSIGHDAFYNCTSLTSITVNAVNPPTLGADAFRNTNNCPIYVPAASVEAYKSASGWSTYASRIQAIP